MGADAVEHVHALGLQIGLPASLAEIGVAQEDLRGDGRGLVGIKRLIDNNPRPLDVDALEAILDAAWHGDPSACAPSGSRPRRRRRGRMATLRLRSASA